MNHEAQFRMVTPHAGIIIQSLNPEGEEEFPGRSSGSCTLLGEDTLEILIKASDLSSLRAALNTWLRLVQVSEEMSNRAQICTSAT